MSPLWVSLDLEGPSKPDEAQPGLEMIPPLAAALVARHATWTGAFRAGGSAAFGRPRRGDLFVISYSTSLPRAMAGRASCSSSGSSTLPRLGRPSTSRSG